MDSFMNIAMEQTEEYQDGQLKAKYGDCFIRGNNGRRRRRRRSALAPVSSIQACIYIDVLRLLCVLSRWPWQCCTSQRRSVATEARASACEEQCSGG